MKGQCTRCSLNLTPSSLLSSHFACYAEHISMAFIPQWKTSIYGFIGPYYMRFGPCIYTHTFSIDKWRFHLFQLYIDRLRLGKRMHYVWTSSEDVSTGPIHSPLLGSLALPHSCVTNSEYICVCMYLHISHALYIYISRWNLVGWPKFGKPHRRTIEWILKVK